MVKKSQGKTTKTVNVVSDEQLQKLQKWNKWFGILFIVQALAIIIAGTSRTFPITTQFLSVDTLASHAMGGETLAVATRHLFDIRMSWLVGLFLILFGAVFLLAATRYRKLYEARLQRGLNDFRWLSFGVGGGVLLAVLGLLSGIYEIATLLLLGVFVLAGCLMLLAAGVIRQANAGVRTRLSGLVCGLGLASVLAPLVMIVAGIVGALLYDGAIPDFLWGVYITTALFFVAVGLLTHFYAIRRGAWADVYRTERAYAVIGFVGASMVAWQIFAGALLP